MGLIHHGILEHFSGQKSIPFSQDYVIDNWESVSDQLANAGMKIVFTGHFHANDIVKKQVGSNFLFDIETGSLITAPCSFRTITLKSDMNIEIATKHIEKINYNTNGQSFQAYAYTKLMDGMTSLAQSQLVQSPFNLDSAGANYTAPYLAGALFNHFAGDEKTDASMAAFLIKLDSLSKNNTKYAIVSLGINTILSDLPPKDNTLTINLNDGSAK